MVKITARQLKRLIQEVLEDNKEELGLGAGFGYGRIDTHLDEDKSGKGKCPDSGCIKKDGNKWRIISNKTGKLWPQKYDSKENAQDALEAYHATN